MSRGCVMFSANWVSGSPHRFASYIYCDVHTEKHWHCRGVPTALLLTQPRPVCGLCAPALCPLTRDSVFGSPVLFESKSCSQARGIHSIFFARDDENMGVYNGGDGYAVNDVSRLTRQFLFLRPFRREVCFPREYFNDRGCSSGRFLSEFRFQSRNRCFRNVSRSICR